MRLGYTTWSMASVRAEDAIPFLAGVGYDSIEIAVVLGWRDSLELLTPARRRRIRQLLQEFDLEECVQLLAPHILLSQVKDERGRQPAYEFLVPGEGEFDYVRYLCALRRAGFDGDVCAEISLRVQRQPGFDPFEAAERS